jgi:hypothetical protein
VYLVEILLPLYDNDKQPFPAALDEVRREMAERL